MKRIILYFFIVLIGTSCKQDDVVASQPKGWGYAGLKLNSSITYEVKKITFNASELQYLIQYDSINDEDVVTYLDGVDTSYYYIKDSIVEIDNDLEGDSIFIIYRYYSDLTSNFKSIPDSVWSAKLDGNQYIRNENNRKLIKLSFPVSYQKEWDINIQNDLETAKAKYTEIRAEKTIGNNSFPDVVTVLHEKLTNEYGVVDSSYEQYAKNVGLAFKKKQRLIGLTDAQKILVTPFVIIEGHITEYRILNYSN